MQAATLAAVLTEQQDELLTDSFAGVPVAMRGAIHQRLPALRRVLMGRPRALEQFELVLAL